MTTGIEWAGTAAKRNCLADEDGAFDTRVPSTALGIRVEDDLVWSDEPPALQKKREKPGFLIEEDSLKENADLIFRFYEAYICEHVVAAQIKDKQVRKLLERDQVDSYPGTGGKDKLLRAFAKSSFLGRDPFGDKATPEGMNTRYKAVLKDVQDAIHTYARVHAKRVCSAEVWERVREVERLHEQFPERLNEYHNKRMPWSMYKDVITALLPRSTGLWEMQRLLAMEREEGKTAKFWASRLSQVKLKIQAKLKKNLTDECYVGIFLDGLTSKEKSGLIKSMIKSLADIPVRRGDTVHVNYQMLGVYYPATVTRMKVVGGIPTYDVVYTERDDNGIEWLKHEILQSQIQFQDQGHEIQGRAMQVLRNMTWANMVSTAAEGIGPQQMYRKRKNYFNRHKLYTYDQALDVCKPAKRKNGLATGTSTKRKKNTGSGNTGQKEAETQPAGNGHKADDPAEVNRKKRAIREAAKIIVDGPRQCALCHKAGRRWRHDGVKCWRKPGGKLHGKSEEEIKEIYRKLREDRESRKGESSKESRQAQKGRRAARRKAKKRKKRQKNKKKRSKSHRSDEQSKQSSSEDESDEESTRDSSDEPWWFEDSTASRRAFKTNRLRKVRRSGRKVSFESLPQFIKAKTDKRKGFEKIRVTKRGGTKRGAARKIRVANNGKPSETAEDRLLKAYVRIQGPGGESMRVLAGLDTHSNVTFIAQDIAQSRAWLEGEQKLVLGLGKHAVETKPAMITLLRKGQPVLIKGRLEPGGQFQDKEMKLLLSAQACKELGVDINATLDSDHHRDVVWRPWQKRFKSTSTRNPNKRCRISKRQSRKITRLAESMMRQYLAKTGGTSRQPKQVSIEDIKWAKT